MADSSNQHQSYEEQKVPFNHSLSVSFSNNSVPEQQHQEPDEPHQDVDLRRPSIPLVNSDEIDLNDFDTEENIGDSF